MSWPHSPEGSGRLVKVVGPGAEREMAGGGETGAAVERWVVAGACIFQVAVRTGENVD